MPTYTIFSSTNDDYLDAQDFTYATAVAGADLCLGSVGGDSGRTADPLDLSCGQVLSGGNFLDESFLIFNTSGIASSETVTSVTFSLNTSTDPTTTAVTAFTAEVRNYTPANPPTTADWRTPTQLGSLTLLASLASGSVAAVNSYTAWTENGTNFQTYITKGGTTSFSLTSDRLRTSTAPSGNEYLQWHSADTGGAGTTMDPKLVIVTVAVSDATPQRPFFGPPRVLGPRMGPPTTFYVPVPVIVPPLQAYQFLVTATLTPSGSITRAVQRPLTASVTPAGAITKATARKLPVATLTPAGTVSKATARALTGTLSFTGTANKAIKRTLTGTLSFTGSHTKTTARALAGGLSFVGSHSKAVARTLTASLTPSGSATKATARNLAASLGPTGSLTTNRIYNRLLTATLNFVGAHTKTTGKALNASVTPTSTMPRSIARTVSATLTPSGNVTKRTSRSLSGSLSFTGALTKSTNKVLAGVLSFVGTLAGIKSGAPTQVLLASGFVNGGVIATPFLIQLPGGTAIFYLLTFVPDEIPVGEQATFSVQLAGSDGTRPSPDLAPVLRVLAPDGSDALSNTTMTLSAGIWSASWTPGTTGAYSIEVRTAYTGANVAAQIPVTVRPRYDPVALALSDVLVSRM